MTLCEASQIAPPIRAHPAQALAQILGVVLERRLHLALAVVLELDLPVVRKQPAGNEVVVVGIQEVVAPPGLVCEAVGEVGVLQNLGPVCHCSAGETGQTAVDPVASGAVEIPPDQVDGAQELPDIGAVEAAQLLVGPDAAHLGILKGSQDPFCELGRQPDIVVEQQGDLGLHLGYRSAQLPALVGLADGQDLDDLGIAQLLDHLVDTLDARIGRDEQQLEGLQTVGALDRLLQLLQILGNGGDDDGHVFGGDGWLVDGLDGRIRPVASQIDP